MKSVIMLAVFPGLVAAATPIAKVLQMLSDLEQKIIKEGETSQKMYEEFAEWCEDKSSTLGNDITTGQSEVKSLKAGIAKDTASISSLGMRIEDLANELGVDQADLKAATEIRSKEASVFGAAEKELMETVDTLQRAISIIEHEMKGGASMMQLKSAASITQALSVLVQASAISGADAGKLNAFIQNSDEDAEPGAPAGAVYVSHSSDILETLSNLLEKAEEQLADLRSRETTDLHNFAMLKQSLEDEISYGAKELAEAKKNMATSSESKSAGEGDLQRTSKELSVDVQARADLHQTCMTKAEDFEAETKSRAEELKALAEAKKVLKETTSGAEAVNYGLNQVSFVQVSRSGLTSTTDLASYEAVRFVRDLADKEHSASLAQLAERMVTAMRHSAGTSDPFAKVKGLIRDMISKLESEAEADASEKVWCDRNLADARNSKAEKTDEIAKLSTKIDGMAVKSAQLKEQVAALQASLAKLAKSQAAMNAMRSQENALFASNTADTEKGLQGVKLALKILSEYYASEEKAHDAAAGAGEGIIGLLEVIESDLTKGLAEMKMSEEAAVAEYERESKENEIEKTTKEQDVKYKTKESMDLDSAAAELSSDRSSAQTELDAVSGYLATLEKRCVAKAETHAQRAARFAAEITGLKEALRILQDETALVQWRSTRRVFRGQAPLKA